MNWVNEKEEWLVDWTEATCLKEVSFEDAHSAKWPQPASEDTLDVFFSDAIEAGSRCLVCRANGSIIDIFDISPLAESLVSWKVRLPNPVVPDIGIACVRDADGAAVSMMFLTKANVMHKLRISLHHATPDLLLEGSTVCNFLSPPSCFCALDRDFVAIGCFNGTLHAVRLGQGGTTYEFTDAPLVQRLINGFVHLTPPPVLALAFGGRSRTSLFSSGFLLLSFTADGKLRLWEALQQCGNLISSRTILSTGQDHAASLLGTSSAYMRVSPSQTRACLVLRSTVLVIDLANAGAADGLAVREVGPPFPSAVPSLVALSHGTLWSFWSCQSREQLFHLDLDEHDALVWQSKALDADLIGTEIGASKAALQRAAIEGCDGTLTGSSSRNSHKNVFTLYQQQEVWRAEEDGFDACQIEEMFADLRQQDGSRKNAELVDLGASYNESFDRDASIEDSVLHWWLNRVFLPGRFSDSVVGAALSEATRLPVQELKGFGVGRLRGAVEDHLQRQASAYSRQAADPTPSSRLQALAALGAAGSALLASCNAIWRRKHHVCGMSASSVWGPHTWHPAGTLTSGSYREKSADTCPLLLCHGGVSCIRPVHSWAERWWATLHLMRDLSNHENLEIEDLLQLSPLDEWKLCATAWFLSQVVGSSSLSLALGLLQRGLLPSRSMRRFAGDVPQHLAAHLSKCAQCLASPTVSTELTTLQELVQLACCPEPRKVMVAGRPMDPTSGVWSGGKTPTAMVEPRNPTTLCLSDIFRGSIAVRECEYLCAALRDLLLLCVYAIHGQSTGDAAIARSEWSMEVEDSAWNRLAGVLDKQLPTFLALYHSMQLGLSHTETAITVRGCDLWASVYRSATDGACLCLRPPVASFKSFQYALQLLRHECWDAIRWWGRHQHDKELGAYLAGRQWVATGRYDPAREAFIHAESVANIVMEGLHASRFQDVPAGAHPDIVAYYVHVARLVSRYQGPPKDEFAFLSKAAHLAEELSRSGSVDRSVCQQLWATTFEKAVCLEMWDAAHDALLRIDAFEGCMRLLAQKLRSNGKMDLVLNLPEKYRQLFMNNLHEQASLSPPTQGSDSLACYQSLYSLHISNKQYLKAAAVAHAMYSRLSSSLKCFVPPEPSDDLCATPQWIQGGDCLSDPSDVPWPRAAAPRGTEPMDVSVESTAHATASDHIWLVLEQQRNALLMVISALSLAPEQSLLLPGPCACVGYGTGLGAKASTLASAPQALCGLKISPSQLQSVRQWFQEAEDKAGQVVFTIADATRLLSVTEANMILSGKTISQVPAKVAHSVAALGLLGLALQITEANQLDHWQFAFQPFLRLCLEADRSTDEQVSELAAAAQGPAQAFMFVRSDGCGPLGAGGSLRGGLWQMLEECLRATCKIQPDSRFLDASATRLYSLVADELLALEESDSKLRGFLTKALSQGPSWVCLLRLYMKHMRLEDAVDLLEEQLRSYKPQSEPWQWSPLQDFPASLAVQLQRYLHRKAEREGSERLSHCAFVLDEVLAQFRQLLAGTEGCAVRRQRPASG